MPGKEYANKPYYNQTSANERKVQAYPSPANFGLLIDFLLVNEMGMSETINHIVKAFFERMTPEDRADLRKKATEKREEGDSQSG